MARNINFKTLSVLLLAMVVSLIISNVYLYHRNYYGQPSFLVVSRSHSNSTTSDQLLRRFDIGFNMKGKEAVVTLHETEQVESEQESMRQLTTKTESEFSSITGRSSERLHNQTSSTNPYNSTQFHHNHTLLMPVRNASEKFTPVMHTRNSSENVMPVRNSSEKFMPVRNTSENFLPVMPARIDNRPRILSGDAALQTPSTRKQQFFGYLLVLKVYEQQTMGTGNLLQLQCFGSKLNLPVVQPFMKDSSLITPLHESQHKYMLRLEDLYNMEDWAKHTEREGYAPLVKWEEFIRYAPRGVVLVQMKYPTLKEVNKHRDSGKAFPHPLSDSRNYRNGCGYKVVEKAMEALKERNFYVVRRVCYNFLSGDNIPLQIYQNDLGGHDLSNVTVIIDEWRGFGENQRLLVKENICPGSASYRDHTHSSSKIARDAQLYADKYLHQNGNTDYLAVITRYEMTAITHRVEKNGDRNAVIPLCIEETLKEIAKMKTATQLTEVFLSVDIGRYGSISFKRHNYYGHQRDLESFVTRVYDKKMSLTDWERTFQTVAEKLDTGYIAKVQQAIVARAKCVLFVGGGSFQQHTLHLYQELHPDPAERCVRVEKKYTSKSRPIQ